MNTEPIANRCPKCQALLPANAPQGLCSKCLLAAAATPTEVGQPPQASAAPPSLETVAAAFPQLEILELIGSGGMGAVYQARQPRLDRCVALKLLPHSLAADPAFAERFSREARLLGRLNHPNIVTVHDFGQSGGFFYLLMEYVDGVNLRQAMAAGRFTPQQAMMLVPKICEALQFAHDEGILHRDIKPSNILLDTRGRVKIADFGIAKLIGDRTHDLTLTASGAAIGTPQYMAPEQLEHPQDVDQRADIYSLGVVFYEMLTGELPIGRFAPPSQKSAVDTRVDEVVFHALEKEREKRFHTASEVKTSVEAITAHPAASAARTSPSPLVVASERHADCYFSTPERMRNCFPAPQAHIFQCKGELRLEACDLVFVSPWQTRVVIPLKDIRDLTVGQFQMWTTPWVMKYERVNFLSITFATGDRERTVHLTPVPAGADSTAPINAHVADWFEAIRVAVVARTGAVPPASDTDAVTIGAQRSWNHKGGPFALAFGVVWVAFILCNQVFTRYVPSPIGMWIGILMFLLLIANVWYCHGFLKANRALKLGRLDEVTSNDPPDSAVTQINEQLPPPRDLARISWLAVGSAVCSIPSWLLVISSLNNLYYSLGPDGLPPKDFTLGLFELMVLGTGGFVGLGALFLGKEALQEIRRGGGGLLGARLAVIGVLGIPTGLLVKFLPFLLGAGFRSFGWQPSSGQGELFVGAVLVGILLLAAWAAQTVRRWAKCGVASGPAIIPP